MFAPTTADASSLRSQRGVDARAAIAAATALMDLTDRASGVVLAPARALTGRPRQA